MAALASDSPARAALLPPLEVWGGLECTVNRVEDAYFSQLDRNCHAHREGDIERFASLGIRADESPFTLFDVWTSREAFICGTAAEVVPVVSVDNRTIGSGGVGPITGRIMQAYHELVRRQGTPINPLPAAQEFAATFKV